MFATNVKQATIDKYKNQLAKMISDADLKNVFGPDTKIYKYSDLKNFISFFDILPNKEDFAFILTERHYNDGHWCALFRTTDDDIYWMDSYAVKPDGELQFIPKSIRIALGENSNELHRLMQSLPQQKFKYFKAPFQTLKEGINTCGRWAMIFVKLCLF